MDSIGITSPKRSDLLHVMPGPSEFIIKSPNLIFSDPIFHESTEEEIKTPDYKILPMRTRKTPKVTLVLDLDETLVHSEMKPIPNPDHTFRIRLNQNLYDVYVAYRPGLLYFLQSVCKEFEVVIFTASVKLYGEHVLKVLDNAGSKKNPSYRLRYKFYRDSCTKIKGNYVKDLRLLGRDLSQVVIIDNSEQAFSFQPENGILISSWFNDQNDKELEKMLDLLAQLKDCQDVREFLQNNINKAYI
jgi:CTD small phosphatase-like protein 2